MNNNNNTARKSFSNSFDSVKSNLVLRYSMNMHMDFINEFIKFADNTRDAKLQDKILTEIERAENNILTLINSYENERDNKENIN